MKKSIPTPQRRAAVLGFLAACALVILPQAAMAAANAAPVEGVLQWFTGVLQGSIARSLAIIAVCFLGFMFLTGRMAWNVALSILVGIGIIFGAGQLVDAMRSTAGN